MDTAKLRVRRLTREIEELDDAKKPTGKMIRDPDSLVVAFTHTDPTRPESTITFIADASKDEFDMTPEQAIAAVETGGFEIHEESKSETENEPGITPSENERDTQPLTPPNDE